MTKKDEMRCSRRSVPLFFLIEHPDRGAAVGPLQIEGRRVSRKEEGSWSREVLLKGHSGERTAGEKKCNL